MVNVAVCPALAAVMPGVVDGRHAFDGGVQPFLGERLLVVGDVQVRGVDLQPSVAFDGGELRYGGGLLGVRVSLGIVCIGCVGSFGEVAVEGHLHRGVHEFAGIGPFESN